MARCDGGDTTRFDPGRVEETYRKAVAELERALSRLEKKAAPKPLDGYDAGLPDLRRSVRRRFRPESPVPERLRGATVYVVTVDRSGAVHGLPREAPKRNDIVLVSRAARLRDCAGLAPVTLLTRELAVSLGIRCAQCRCVVSADGSEIEIIEGDEP